VAVAVDMKFKGASLDQYDQVIQKMGLRQGGEMPPGGISHWVAKTDDGVHIVDVWESKEAFEKFAEEKIRPYTQEVGITREPEISFSDVHNYLTK
jgi:hypothetical protein